MGKVFKSKYQKVKGILQFKYVFNEQTKQTKKKM